MKKRVNRRYNSQFTSNTQTVQRVKPSNHRKLTSEPCDVLMKGVPCGLPAHYVVGKLRVCRERHQHLAFRGANKTNAAAAPLAAGSLASMAQEIFDQEGAV